MSKFWFRKNHQLDGPARLAETQAVATRQEAYDRAKDATIHLLTAFKQWPGFDSTGSIIGVIDHTQVNIDRLDDALDDLRDQIDAFRGEILREKFEDTDRSALGVVRPGISVEIIDVKAITKAMATAVQVVPTPVTAAFARRKPVDGASK